MIPKFFKALRIVIRRAVVLFQYITSEKKQTDVNKRTLELLLEGAE